MSYIAILQRGREKSVKRRHLWIFSGAIKRLKGKPQLGDLVRVEASDGAFLAWAAFSPQSDIRLKIWSFSESEQVDVDFFQRKIETAVSLRAANWLAAGHGINGPSACRWVAAESDGLPGLVVDRYQSFLVCQFLTAGCEKHKADIVAALANAFPEFNLYERSDADSRLKEGLPRRKGVLKGQLPPTPLMIEEAGFNIAIDLIDGHKTGFYLDQQDNRQRLEAYCRQKSVLNCFCYSGTFGLYALRGGCASLIQVDASQAALALCQENLTINDFSTTPDQQIELIKADVFQLLRDYRAQNRRFDVIVLDPPKFADHQQHIKAACRGYQDINRLAMQLLNPMGLLLTFSCSGRIALPLFQKIPLLTCSVILYL